MFTSDIIRALQDSSAKHILLIPFEDRELIQQLRAELPDAEINVVTKNDMSGVSVLGLISRVREHAFDAVVGSLHSSALKRNQTSFELLLGFGRARKRYLRIDRDEYVAVSLSRMFFFLLPRFAFGFLVGGMFLLTTYLLVLFLQTRTPKKRMPSLHLRPGGTILFLRTDLAGPLKAGGSVSHIKGMVKAFRELGFHVVYVADATLEALPAEVTQVQIRPMAVLDFFDEFQLIGFNLQLLLQSQSLLRSFRPALIYQRHSIFSFAGGFIARRGNIPVVVEANASEVWVKKHWSRLMFVDLAERCESLALKSSTRVAVISEAVREQLQHYDIPQEALVLNPNGVDLDEFHPRVDGTEVRRRLGLEDNIVAGFIGTFTRWHGVETLLEAAASVLPLNPKIKFLFIGDGDLRTSLEQQSRELRINNRCVFTGIVPQEEAPRYLAACDILVSPHLGFEDGTRFFGSPTKLFEYMAMGKPIVASNLEQIGEIIQHEVNGLKFPPGDAGELSKAVLRIAKEKELASRLGAQARKDVESKYAWVENAKRLMISLQQTIP